eukprot:8634257-Pyramimonas_sp.AAC.1
MEGARWAADPEASCQGDCCTLDCWTTTCVAGWWFLQSSAAACSSSDGRADLRHAVPRRKLTCTGAFVAIGISRKGKVGA